MAVHAQLMNNLVAVVFLLGPPFHRWEMKHLRACLHILQKQASQPSLAGLALFPLSRIQRQHFKVLPTELFLESQKPVNPEGLLLWVVSTYMEKQRDLFKATWKSVAEKGS